MSGKAEDPSLIALGAALSDGHPIDWVALERGSTDPERQALLEQLRQVAQVIAAHRGAADADVPAAPEAAVLVKSWGHLVLFESLGTGAFGTVYRGWDPQLDREVAVKLLPVTPDRSDTAALEEARNLALVRHPNVVGVYGVDQHDGQAGIWMEYIEGQTLAEIVRERGPMSAREVAGIGVELCRAVSALHASALLHRDIKAENVMREVGGRVVLMDFSGAEFLHPHDRTRLSGTPLYMAPELFTGGEATFASDVYSLGVLLFFLLTADLPVPGTTFTELEQAHASGERRRVRDLRPDIGDAIVQIIERATARDPASRYQSAGELEHALAAASGWPAAPSQALAAGQPAPTRRRSGLPAWGIVAAAFLVGLTLAAGAEHWRHSEPGRRVTRFEIGPPYLSGSWPRLSPDGRHIVFGAWSEGRNRFWIRPLDSPEGRTLAATTATASPFWSPDGRTLTYFHAGKLWKIDVDTTQPEALTQALETRGGSWSARGTILYAQPDGLYTIAPDGSGRVRVTTVDAARGEFEHAWPEFLPDGRRYLFLVRSSQADYEGVYLGTLGTPNRTRVMPAYSRTTYADGHLFFVRDGTLVAQRFNEDAAVLLGTPVPITDRVHHHGGSDAAFDVSATGTLVYALSEAQPVTRLTLFDRRGRELEPLSGPSTFRRPRFSPDGQRVVAERTDGSGNTDLWMYDLNRRSEVRLTKSEFPDTRPAWSPDGRRIAFSSRRGSQYRVYVKEVDSTAEERPVVTSADGTLVESWSPDGRNLSVGILRSGLWVTPLAPGRRPWQIRSDPGMETWASAFSPDGRWLAYTSRESGTHEIYVEPFPGTGDRWQVSSQGGSEPHWRGDSGELFYLNGGSELMAVEVAKVGSWRASEPRRLFPLPTPELTGTGRYAVSPDGTRFVVNYFISDPMVPPVQVVLNWTGLLPR